MKAWLPWVVLAAPACSAPVHGLGSSGAGDALYVLSMPSHEVLPAPPDRVLGPPRVEVIAIDDPAQARTVWTSHDGSQPEVLPSQDQKRLFLGRDMGVSGFEIATGVEDGPLLFPAAGLAEPPFIDHVPLGDPSRIYLGREDLIAVDLGPSGGLAGATPHPFHLIPPTDVAFVTAIASSADGSKLYVAIDKLPSPDDPPRDQLSIRLLDRDGAAGDPGTPIDLDPSCSPNASIGSIAVSRDDQLVLWQFGCILVWDPASKKTVRTVQVSNASYTYDPVHHRAWVASKIGSELLEIDLSTGTIVHHSGLSDEPFALAVTSNGAQVFVATTTRDEKSDRIDIFDAEARIWTRDAVRFATPRAIQWAGLIVR